jgi:hypothetical protein
MVSTAALKRIAIGGGIAALGAAIYMQFRVQDKFRDQGFYKKSIRIMRDSR